MNPRPKGKEEFAYNKACLKVDAAFSEAEESGVDLDDLLYYAYGLITRRTDRRPRSTATEGSAFELWLKKAPQNEEKPVQDALREGRTPSQESSGKNPGCPGGPARAPNNSPEENRPCPEWCHMKAAAAILEALFELSDPAMEGCAAIKRLLVCARQAAGRACIQSDTREPRPVATCQVSCRECLQTILSFPRYMNFQLPCSCLEPILQQGWGKAQDTGGAV